MVNAEGANPSGSMVCAGCGLQCSRFGKHRNGLQRFRCSTCGKTYTETHGRLFGAMTVDEGKALLALQLLVEGNSIRSTERITAIDRNTIMRLLVVAGERCKALMTARVQNLKVEHLEMDEVWAYVGCHQKFVDHDRDDAYFRGDQYYNFCRIHRSLRVTPAMEAGITNHVWELRELFS